MGKTPKKAAPGGDERNLYNRRLKATTAPSNASETSLHKRQCESEISNRSKLTTLQKRVPSGPRKGFTSKLRARTKFELSRTAKPVGRPPGSVRDKKATFPEEGKEFDSEKMQPESEEAEVKLGPSVRNEEPSEDASKDRQESEKERVDHALSEPASISEDGEASVNKEAAGEGEQQQQQQQQQQQEQQQQTECQKREEKPGSSNNKSEGHSEEAEETEVSLTFDAEESPAKSQEVTADESRDTKEESVEENKRSPSSVTTKNGVAEKEDVQSESQTDTESYSADVLECTASEISEASESASQNDATQKEKEKEQEQEKEKKERAEEAGDGKEDSFVSYDPSIMLKDVQIKLNDCLKENSKLFDTSNASHGTPSQPARDVSFGKTLRSISGRRSLSRMRHVTIREHRYSPNDSLFVNTSSASLAPDDTADFKILRYSTDTLFTSNGSPTERKRKHDTEDWNSSTKKPKTDTENSVLHSPISLLKGLRRPIQVSTPVSELKFQSGKLDLDEERKPAANEATKKWCIVM